MTDEEIVAKLRQILRPTIEWYRTILEGGVTDGGECPRDYLYDMTWDAFDTNQTAGDYQALIEALL